MKSLSEPLDDKHIRSALKSFLQRRSPAPNAIFDELRVIDGQGVADVVALYKKPHCYEIKGETDSIYRIQGQASLYDKSFPQITLVTTHNHLDGVMKEVPSHWGIVLTYRDKKAHKFVFVRGAKLNHNQTIRDTLRILWKSELALLLSKYTDKALPTRATRNDLIDAISACSSLDHVNKYVSSALYQRLYNNPFKT